MKNIINDFFILKLSFYLWKISFKRKFCKFSFLLNLLKKWLLLLNIKKFGSTCNMHDEVRKFLQYANSKIWS